MSEDSAKKSCGFWRGRVGDVGGLDMLVGSWCLNQKRRGLRLRRNVQVEVLEEGC